MNSRLCNVQSCSGWWGLVSCTNWLHDAPGPRENLKTSDEVLAIYCCTNAGEEGRTKVRFIVNELILHFHLPHGVKLG